MLTRMLLASTFLVGISAPAFSADPVQAVAPAAPAHDMQGVSGYVDLFLGYSHMDMFPSGGGEYDGFLIGGAGRANIWLSPAIGLQLDAWGDSVSWDLECCDDENATVYSSFGIGSHLAWRDPNSYAFGALASVGDGGHTRWVNVGVEGQMYFGDLTLYGQGGYTDAVDGGLDDGDYDANGFYIFGEARYFVMPNLMVAGHLAYDDLDAGGGNGDITAFRWGVKAEYQPMGSPVAGFVSYHGANGDWTDEDINEHTFIGGIKILLGQDSLQTNNNYGATFVDHNPMFGEYRLRSPNQRD